MTAFARDVRHGIRQLLRRWGAGPADAVRPGAWYLRVPNADLDPTVADRVIRFPTVQEVGPAPCPVR